MGFRQGMKDQKAEYQELEKREMIRQQRNRFYTREKRLESSVPGIRKGSTD